MNGHRKIEAGVSTKQSFEECDNVKAYFGVLFYAGDLESLGNVMHALDEHLSPNEWTALNLLYFSSNLAHGRVPVPWSLASTVAFF